ncbi:Bacterial regulatory protein, crp family [compost metagenome]
MYMADRLGVMLRPYTTRLKISVTQQEIADSLGLTRETANIELKKLEMLKLISHSRKSYVLYMERLQKYIEDK